ncbi:MAG TPA: nucleotide sugar dehydrogenase [Armatimonadota bacterium]|jgi:UDP-N-acetyl-D-glucosamine dehydrogenase
MSISVDDSPEASISLWATLAHRIETMQATVAVIGLGYVGLPLSVAFARKGFSVIGFDANAQKVEALQDGQSYILDVPSTDISAIRDAQRFQATDDAAALRTADALIICVPTPCQRNREPDLSYIHQAAETIADHLRPGQLVILESTTYPGTTEELLVPILERSGLRCGESFQVAFSPERIDPGNPTFHVENTPKVVGGLGAVAGELASALYGMIIERIIHVDSPREAEMAKLIENTFRHVNIALANELAIIARKMGVNIWQAISASASKPFGFMPFYPGPGVGGHCIPIDPLYLSWKAKEMGAETSFIELAERINRKMPEYVVRLAIDAVNQAGKSICGAAVLLLGLAYKRDIDDLRESPALEIIAQLQQHGANISYHDPFVPSYRNHEGAWDSVELTPEALQHADCVLITTDHSSLDRQMIATHAPLIIDARNYLHGIPGDHIVRL